MNRFKGSGSIITNSKKIINIDEIIDCYSNYVYKVIDNIVGKSLTYQDKEELVSDTFFLLWKYQDNIKTDLKSYLGKIAKNLSYKKIKSNTKFDEYDDRFIGKEVNLEINIDLEGILSKLTLEEKEIFNLYYIEGYKLKEISKMKNKSLSAIKMNLFRLRKKLKEVIDNEKY